MYKRLWWDALGLKKWLKHKNIEPIATISLQNTGFKVGKKVPSFIYYHQSIPFYPQKWNPFKKKERTFWFYKYIYTYFVRLFLKKDTKIFVQLNFIKEGFAKKYNHPKELIEVYTPTVLSPSGLFHKQQLSDKLIFFYPATNFFYKNHRVISKALSEIEDQIEVRFTTSSSGINPNDPRISYLGMLPYSKVYEMYNSCDALLFPSYIETFGLPLIEAAITGLPIIAADLPYAREVLKGYTGATYVPYDNPHAWADAIQKIKKGKRYKPLDITNRKSWSDLFNSIISKIN